MSDKELKVLFEKVDGGYIVADPNPDPKHPADFWINRSEERRVGKECRL